MEKDAVLNGIFPSMEAPPKWALLEEVLDEIRSDCRQRQVQPNAQTQTATTGKAQGSADEAGAEGAVGGGGGVARGRVLVLVRDERTAAQLRDVISYGRDFVTDQRYRWFISQQVTRQQIACSIQQKLT
jgi:hypothetical protein